MAILRKKITIASMLPIDTSINKSPVNIQAVKKVVKLAVTR